MSIVGSAEGTHDNPYLTGDNFVLEGEEWMAEYMKFEFELLETKRGEQAYQFLIEEDGEWSVDKRLEKAEKEGKEILLAKIYVKALELEEQPFDINSFSLLILWILLVVLVFMI